LAAALVLGSSLSSLASAEVATPGVRLAPAAPAVPDTAAPLAADTIVVRRAPNPHYRPPSERILPTRLVAPRQNGFDHLYAQISGRGLSSEVTTGDAHFILERLYKDTDRVTLQVDGTSRSGLWSGRETRLETRDGRWAGDVGDLLAFAPFPEMDFHAARGLFLGRQLAHGGTLALTAGRPSPWATGDGAQFLALTGQDLPSQTTKITGAAGAFRWDSGRYSGSSAWQAVLGQHTPLWGGEFGSGLGLQRHDLGPGATSAAAIGVEYRTQHPAYALSLRARRATDGMRILTDEEADVAPRQELAAEGQTRFWRRRAELHSSLTRFAGGDSTRNWRSAQVGGSSQFGPSPWYAGCHAAWDVPGTSNVLSRQIGAYMGRSGGSSAPLVLRLQQTWSPASATAWELAGETSFGIGRTSRLSVEPLAEWREHVVDRAGVTLGGSRPLPWAGSRLTMRLRVESLQARDYRVGVSEAEIAFTFRPRARDTMEMELRQGLDIQGYELTSTYDMQQPRYAGSSTPARRRDASDLVVRVEHSDGTGVDNVLVSLDGKEVRFTDSSGQALFENVTPGVHEVTLEERTLPEGWHVQGSARQLFSVERDVTPQLPRFTIERLEKVEKF
jgi:hypothetical protein